MFSITVADRRGEIYPPAGTSSYPEPVKLFPTRNAAQAKAEEWAKTNNRPYYILQVIGRTNAILGVETVWE